MDAAIPADAQNAPTGIWKSRTEREIPTAPTPIIVVVNERKNNGDSNSVAKLSTESDQAHTQSLRSTMDSPRQRSTLHRLSVVWPMNDNHEGPVPPGVGRECVDSTRYTTFLSMLAPNVREMMRAIRGQPNRGVRDVSSTMAWMSAALGPFGPGCCGHALDETSRRYVRRTNA